MAINLEEHKVFVDELKMDMIPYSIALQAVQEVSNIDTEQYAIKLENAMLELRNSLNNIKING